MRHNGLASIIVNLMDAQVVAAVRELLARAPGVGVNAMVKHIRGEWPELADRVNAKVVRQAKAVLAVEAAAAEGESVSYEGG